MNFHVLTLFPEMIENGMNTSITGRAITKGLLTLEAVNIRDYAFNKHQKVDDYTYGGELPAMVMMDSISRMVPGVLNNQESGETESFAGNLLEYPQYSRPEEWHGKKVPEVLMSGHHANIEKWRREQSIYRTAKRRPDLLKKADLTNKEWNYVRQLRKQWKEEEEQTK